MKVGMNLFLWTLDLTDEMFPIIESLAEMGYDGLEVPIFDTSIDYASWGERLDGLGLERTAVAVRGEEDNPASLDPAIRAAAVAATNETLDCAAALGASALVGPLHSALGVFTGAPPTADEWAASVDALQQSCDHASGLGLDIGIEALNRFECYLLNSQADAARYVNDVGAANCKVLYDTFHANIEEKDEVAAIRQCADQLGYVHISENDRSTPGAGNVAWDETFAALSEIGYDGWFIIEAFGQAMPDFAAATKIWRPMFESEDQLVRDGLAFIKQKYAEHAGT
jgi:D-psicose/D-tagatose/L-ribulose 3-epimerase